MNVDYLRSSLKENGCCAAIFARPSLVFPRKGACLPLFIPLLNPLGWTKRSVRFCIKRTVCAILPLLLHALMELIVARVAMPGLVCCHKTGIERSRFNLCERIVELDGSVSCRLLNLPRCTNKDASLTLISLTSSSDSSSGSSAGACSSPYVRKQRCQIHPSRIFAIILSARTTFPVALHLAKLPTNPIPTNLRVPTFPVQRVRGSFSRHRPRFFLSCAFDGPMFEDHASVLVHLWTHRPHLPVGPKVHFPLFSRSTLLMLPPFPVSLVSTDPHLFLGLRHWILLRRSRSFCFAKRQSCAHRVESQSRP